MERDCLIGYGAAHLILERLMLSSDQFIVHVCRECGFIGFEGHCMHCDGEPSSSGTKGDNMVSIKMPYASKLMLQEL